MRLATRLAALWLLAGTAPGLRVERTSLRIPMRDGVYLSANLFRAPAAVRLPVLVARTPYGKGVDPYPGYDAFLQSGYAVVIQDVRGRGQSEGRFRMMTQEETDGADTLAWIARQPWCDGRIGLVGGSYLGIVQWKAALSGSPHLKAISPWVAGAEDYFDRFYSRGGALKLGHRLSWMAANLRERGYPEPRFREYVNHLPLRTSDRVATGRTIDFWQDALDHPSYDWYWRGLSTRDHLRRVQAPPLIVTGWYDNYVESDLEAFAAVSRRLPARIVVGPWPHAIGERFRSLDFGPQTQIPLRRMQLDWFDRWVKGQPGKAPQAAPVTLFVMGLNAWRNEKEWPIARTRHTNLYLASHGLLAPEPHRGDTPDRFVYDPRHPVPTQGGAVCCSSRIWAWGPLDQRSVETRPDVLVYSSEPLARDLEVTGEVRVVLSVSTSAPDTDFTAKLVDVYPDGRAFNLCDGVLRLRYRESLERPVLAQPGAVYRIVIPAGVTSNLFRAGHRIRLEISSSNFPRFDRNPNTGTAIAGERQLRPATQTVFHDRQHSSYIVLPVIPAGQL